jgi:predicted phosphatase
MKPILFHDIDGVLFGEYDGAFQLRPAVNTWLEWAFEHFEVIWLTSWDQEKVKALLTVTYNGNLLHQFHYAEWTNYADKTVWLAEALQRLGERDVYWIDDEAVPVEGIEAIRVNSKGAHELIAVQAQLDQLLAFVREET